MMRPRIAIPTPHSVKSDYNGRTLPFYKSALEACGAVAVEVPLSVSNEEVAKIVTGCQGVLLPGSPADIDPQKFGQERAAETHDADAQRDNVDELLLQDAYNMRKPIFGICYGLQSINVWRTGTLVQHIASNGIEHAAGSKVSVVHIVKVEPGSTLAEIAKDGKVPVNSSHHQSADVVGDGLKVSAKSDDNIVEAIEGTDPKHYVMGVQWHPERTFESEPVSRALFEKFVEEAKKWVAASADERR